VWLPRMLRAAGAPERARLIRQAGTLALGWAGVDLGLTAGLPLLKLAYPPVRGSFYYLLCGRAAIAGGSTALALASVLAGPDTASGTRRWLGRLGWAVHAAMAAAVVYASYIEGQRLGVSRVSLAFPGHG